MLLTSTLFEGQLYNGIENNVLPWGVQYRHIKFISNISVAHLNQKCNSVKYSGRKKMCVEERWSEIAENEVFSPYRDPSTENKGNRILSS